MINLYDFEKWFLESRLAWEDRHGAMQAWDYQQSKIDELLVKMELGEERWLEKLSELANQQDKIDRLEQENTKLIEALEAYTCEGMADTIAEVTLREIRGEQK